MAGLLSAERGQKGLDESDWAKSMRLELGLDVGGAKASKIKMHK